MAASVVEVPDVVHPPTTDVVVPMAVQLGFATALPNGGPVVPWTIVLVPDRLPDAAMSVIASGVQLTGMLFIKKNTCDCAGSSLHSSMEASAPALNPVPVTATTSPPASPLHTGAAGLVLVQVTPAEVLVSLRVVAAYALVTLPTTSAAPAIDDSTPNAASNLEIRLTRFTSPPIALRIPSQQWAHAPPRDGTPPLALTIRLGGVAKHHHDWVYRKGPKPRVQAWKVASVAGCSPCVPTSTAQYKTLSWFGVRGVRVLKHVALSFISVGLLLLSFVAYQLWGTALYEHNAQNQLRHELAGKLHAPPTTTTPPPPTPGATTTTASPADLVNQVAPSTPDPAVGTPIGLLSIPRLGMQGVAIVEGTAEAQLQQGPGHYVGTPLPGQAGNAAIAGHRTTYGAPFYDLNTLEPGDSISITTAQGFFEYQVVTSHVVLPSNVTVLAQTSLPELTLTTCNPRYSAAQRLVVVAILKTSVTSASFPTTTTLAGTSTTGPSSATTAPSSLAGGGEGGGLGGVSTRGEVAEAGLWGALTVISAILGLIGWRRGRRPWSLVVLSMGVPLTVAALLVCYQHISLALPQSF